MIDIKVANVIEDSRYGGIQARILSVMKEMRKQKQEIESIIVLPNRSSSQFLDPIIQLGIKFKEINLHRLSRKKLDVIKYIMFFVYEVLNLLYFFKNEEIDIVHCNGIRQIKGIISGRLAKKKVVLSLNDTHSPRIIYILFLFLYRFCDGFILSGDRVKRYYLINGKIERKPYKVIRPAVDMHKFDPKNNQTSEEILGGKYKSSINILTIANINPIKGLEYFIKMIHLLNKKYRKINFFIVGPVYDSQEKYFKSLLGLVKKLNIDNLRFTGPLYNTDKVLSESDIFVCSSIAESGPITVAEALSMCKPVVSTNVGDVSIYLKDRESGFIVPVKDSNALADRVGILIENKKLRREMGRIGRTIAKKYLDIENSARQHAEFYKRII